MNQELISIVAAYWGAKCSWTSPYGFREQKKGTVSHFTMPFADTTYHFKLHLRPLWSITEEELRELGEVLGLKEYNETLITKSIGFANILFFQIWDDNKFMFAGISGEQSTNAINHLRANGFCVDQELVDAGLVEWKEV